MSEQFPEQISIGSIIEFASIFFENYPAKVDDGAQVDDCARVDDRAWARRAAKRSFALLKIKIYRKIIQ